jgi:arylsulfatase A-like enzyme
VIVADDLGYNDLTFGGGGVANGAVPTPNIDGIARAGVQYTRGYTGNATCAPVARGDHDGRYPQRFGFEFTPAPKAFMRLIAYMRRDEARPPVYYADREADVPAMEQEGIPPDEVTIAELLRDRGYRTLGFGKWHLGEAPPMQPTRRASTSTSASCRARRCTSTGTIRTRELGAGLRSDRQFLWANLVFAVRKDGGTRFTPDAT